MEIAFKNMAADHIIARLQKRLIDDVTDDSAAAVVRVGKLQDDPTKGTGINVLLWMTDDQSPDELYTDDKQEGLFSPTYEVGGGVFFMRHFQINVLFHFRGLRGEEGRLEAARKSEIVMSRIRHELLRINHDLPKHPETGLTRDDFDECVIALQITDWTLNEGGGSGHFIWKGQIDFSFLTEQLVQE